MIFIAFVFQFVCTSANASNTNCSDLIESAGKENIQIYLINWVDEIWDSKNIDKRIFRYAVGGGSLGMSKILKKVEWDFIGIHSSLAHARVLNPLVENRNGEVVDRYDLAEGVFFSTGAAYGIFVSLSSEYSESDFFSFSHLRKITDRVYVYCRSRSID
jgi:hypothetical protein